MNLEMNPCHFKRASTDLLLNRLKHTIRTHILSDTTHNRLLSLEIRKLAKRDGLLMKIFAIGFQVQKLGIYSENDELCSRE